MINRRQFSLGTAALISQLSAVPAGLASVASHHAPLPAERRLMGLGLNALARAAEMSYFADGHRGASMISAHLMCVDNDFGEAATARIAQLFDLNWAPKKLCEPFPEADPVDDAAKRIGLKLADGKGVLREVGHDAIFAMHAIKGFAMLPELATPQRVEGICQLIGKFKPWRDEAPDPEVDPPPFQDSQSCSRYILREASEAIDRFVGFGQGFAGHMLTFGQSLVEMCDLGHEEWAESCRPAFRKYVTVTRRGPQPRDRKIKPHAFRKLRPDDAEYWQQRGDKSLGLGHVFKYPYAYYDLLDRADDPDLERELEAKAWRIF